MTPVCPSLPSSWLKAVLGDGFDDIHESLRSGVALCTLLNKIKPGTIKKINKFNQPYMQMENIKVTSYTQTRTTQHEVARCSSSLRAFGCQRGDIHHPTHSRHRTPGSRPSTTRNCLRSHLRVRFWQFSFAGLLQLRAAADGSQRRVLDVATGGSSGCPRSCGFIVATLRAHLTNRY